MDKINQTVIRKDYENSLSMSMNMNISKNISHYLNKNQSMNFSKNMSFSELEQLGLNGNKAQKKRNSFRVRNILNNIQGPQFKLAK